jgi:hypothetical protein
MAALKVVFLSGSLERYLAKERLLIKPSEENDGNSIIQPLSSALRI